MEITPITQSQWKKVAKALAYSFVSGFLGTLVLLATDFIRAASTGGTGAVVDLAFALVVAAVIGGINATFVAVKQLLTNADVPPAA